MLDEVLAQHMGECSEKLATAISMHMLDLTVFSSDVLTIAPEASGCLQCRLVRQEIDPDIPGVVVGDDECISAATC